MNLILGIVVAIAVLVFFFYASIAVRHAAQFRYLSKRTVYLTVFFVSLSSALLILILVTGLILILN